MRIPDSVGWDVGENIDAIIDGDIGGKVYSGVDIEVQIEGGE